MITDANPFVYSRPIPPDEVIDRDEETAKLLELAVGGHYVRLYAPRKFGKTSLLGRVLRDGERQEGLVPIMVDLYGVLSIADITVRVERASSGSPASIAPRIATCCSIERAAIPGAVSKTARSARCRMSRIAYIRGAAKRFWVASAMQTWKRRSASM